MKWAYYNDVDKDKCEWVRELIRAGVITDGEVDSRPIQDVRANELVGFRRVHLFCGIAVWDYALRRAGVGDGEQVWSASTPCPPFSQAGKRKFCPECDSPHLVPHVGRTGYFVCVLCGHEWLADARHLWPEVWRLVRDARPRVLYGEQVASIGGLTWFDGVKKSLNDLNYAVVGVDIPSSAMGATDIRQRLYFFAKQI